VRPASAGERAQLNELFEALCAIASPSGHEAACARRVTHELRSLGLEPVQDDAGPRAGSDCGNLLVRIPGTPEATRTVLLCAHLDTVDHDEPIEPELVDGVWRNARPAILGADNKAALAVFLVVARRCVAEPAPVGLELLLTVAEERGLAGAKAFDATTLRSEFGYVLDHATAIGELVLASPGYYRIEAVLRGVAAHAGIRPEEGRSAVVAASAAVAAMPLGRLDAQTTANVGRLDGGVESTNVVPERCRLLAEVRSLDPVRAEAVVAELVDHLSDAANAGDCDLDVDVERGFTGYRQRPTLPAVLAAEAALRRRGHEPRHIATGGGSDANVLCAAGLPCVNLANGTERNHEPGEQVSALALEEMLDVVLGLLDEAAAV